MRSTLILIIFVCSVAPAYAQVVQLPSVGSFSVSTTVSVPDQGTASLGGNAGYASGSTTRGFGPFANGARGGRGSANHASVSVTIIDLAAMDEALLNQAPETNSAIARNHRAPRQGTKIVNTLTPHHYDRVTTPRAVPSQPYDWMRALGPHGNDVVDSAESKVRDGSNVRFFMAKAAEAHASGHTAAAKVYYSMALERMTPAQIQRLDEIRAARAAKPADSSKTDADAAKNTAPAAATAPEGTSTASPFDAPSSDGSAPAAGANTDMNSSPF